MSPPTLSLAPTDPRWLATAMADLPAVHRDHLHCERKAAQSALSLVRSYPERVSVVEAVARLAHEETAHVVQVTQLLGRAGLAPVYDHGDDYATALRALVRKGEPGRLLDRLLVFALIEARSAERLGLLADALAAQPEVDARTASLYAALATAELRHRDTFLELAAEVAPDEAGARAAELAAHEATILAGLPVRARIH
ncbi:MAG: tRNA isopentenyl-2-thiomethyl-A-37 hydroxylase MiaE [Kofleriaceae bacterium]